jgi:ubiquinone/menaquinone biosynthesis C-methylase UbiE
MGGQAGEQEHRRRFHGAPEMLRSPGRVELLEVPRVVSLCLAGIAARTVLDVGTGTGIFAEAFSVQGLEVTGIDANPAMIEVARRLVPNGQFRHAPAEVVPYPDGAFDLVFMGLVLHETDDPLQALKEARRVARKRGAVLEWPYQETEHGPPPAHRLQPEKIAEMAQTAGFMQVETLLLAHLVLYRLR